MQTGKLALRGGRPLLSERAAFDCGPSLVATPSDRATQHNECQQRCVDHCLAIEPPDRK